MVEPNPYQSPNDISMDAETPLTAEDAMPFDGHDPLLGPASICLIGSLFIMMYAGLGLLLAAGRIALSDAGAWESLGVALSVFLAASLMQFAGHAMLNRRHRLVVIFASVLGLATCVLALPFAFVLFRMSKPDVWDSFR